MGMGLRPGLGLGSAQGVPYTDIILPQSANIIRAWSLRRLIPEYANGIAVMADRDDDDPAGLPDDDGFAVNFQNNGEIIIPAGLDAGAYELHDQRCGSDCKLTQNIFAKCPEVFSQTEGTRKALRFTKDQFLQMANIDTILDTALTNIAIGHSVSLWCRFSTVVGNAYILNRRSVNAGWLRFIRIGTDIRMLHRNSVMTTGTILSGASANTWYHIVLTAKGANGENGLKTYVNAATPITQDIKTVSGASVPMSIGEPTSTNTGITEINDLVFWNRELSAGDVLSLFNVQSTYYGVSAK